MVVGGGPGRGGDVPVWCCGVASPCRHKLPENRPPGDQWLALSCQLPVSPLAWTMVRPSHFDRALPRVLRDALYLDASLNRLRAAGQHRPGQLHDHVAALDEAFDIVQGFIIAASAPRSPARARSRSRSQAPDKYPRPYWRPSEGGSLVRYLRISGQRWGYHFYL